MKKRRPALPCLFLSLCLLLCACAGHGPQPDGGGTGPQTTEDPPETSAFELCLPYSASDPLNPFFAAGIENLALADLFCQPLFCVLADYTPKAVLAADCRVSADAAEVSLKPAHFSDGSVVTPADVLYSFKRAKTSGPWMQRLSGVRSAGLDGQKIVFALSEPDVYVRNALTFPVVKKGTAERAGDVPVGSGPYLYADGGFVRDPKRAEQGGIDRIRLYKIKDFSRAVNALEIGNVDFLFDDLSSGRYRRAAAENTAVPLNNFVFLGINGARGALSSAAVRTALCYAIDRTALVSSSYQGFAAAAPCVFEPAFAGLSGVRLPPAEGDAAKAERILDKSGYNRYAKDGGRTDGTTELKFTLLVNSENLFRVAAARQIAESLGALDVLVSVQSVPMRRYLERLTAGDFQLYLGEVRLTENMDLSCFFKEGGCASTGIDGTLNVCADYAALRAGKINVQAFVDGFMDEVPFVPLCYRCGLASYRRGLVPDFSRSAFSLYGEIAAWKPPEERPSAAG